VRIRILLASALAAAISLVPVPAFASHGTHPALTDRHPCPDRPGFTCATLVVPLDHRGHDPGTLSLQVAVADNVDAPKGVLLFLSGGPGQPGMFLTSRVPARLPALVQQFRLVVIDQRGTGDLGAINCPDLQTEVGSSDVTAPSRAAVRACAGIVGESRRHYGTADTVEDLDWLRRAVGVQKMVLDGVSYGAFVAARYAIAHPHNTRAIVLDSVLPHVDPQRDDAMYVAALRATDRVLRSACAALADCNFDPADDLAWVVRHRADSVPIFDLMIAWNFVDPNYHDFMFAVHAARNGDPTALDALLASLPDLNGAPPNFFSSGLHAATICADMPMPWGNASAPERLRQAALDRAQARLSERDVWPWLPATGAGNGFVQTCLNWPRMKVNPDPVPLRIPRIVPVLIVNGDQDTVTPLEWAFEEARYAPNHKVIVVPGAAHSIQNRERSTIGRDAINAFLLG
jgi:pimeloyl-ACP methyl ester carboxylesterase